MREKNPYGVNTPEYMLFENIEAAAGAGRAFSEDVSRYTAKAAEQREREALFREALQKLTADKKQSAFERSKL